MCVLGPEIDNWQEWRSLSEKWRRKGREELFCFWWNEAWGGAIWLSSDIWCNLVIHSFTITTISLVTYRYNAKMRGEGEDSLYEGQKQKLRCCCFIYWLPKVKRGCHIFCIIPLIWHRQLWNNSIYQNEIFADVRQDTNNI